jgi:hypothetical protein
MTRMETLTLQVVGGQKWTQHPLEQIVRLQHDRH